MLLLRCTSFDVACSFDFTPAYRYILQLLSHCVLGMGWALHCDHDHDEEGHALLTRMPCFFHMLQHATPPLALCSPRMPSLLLVLGSGKGGKADLLPSGNPSGPGHTPQVLPSPVDSAFDTVLIIFLILLLIR